MQAYLPMQASFASAAFGTPLTTSGPSHAWRSHATSAMVAAGSNIRVIRSATVASNRVKESKLEGLGSEEVPPPSGPGGAIDNGPQRQRRRDGGTVSHVAQPGPGHRRVDGQDEGLVAGRGGPSCPAVGLGRDRLDALCTEPHFDCFTGEGGEERHVHCSKAPDRRQRDDYLRTFAIRTATRCP